MSTIRDSVGHGSILERSKRNVRDNWFSYLLIAPSVVFLIALLWLPFFRGVWMSLHDWPFIGDPTWIGLGHYEFLIGYEPFITSLKATVLFAAITLFQLIVALVAAISVKHVSRFKQFIVGSFLIAYTMPPLVSGTIWKYILAPDLGPVFGYLTQWGVLEQPIYWGSDGGPAMAIIMFVGTWTFWPFMFLIIVASLQNIPEEHYESARMYGASRFQQFLRVTLPQLKSAILVAVSIRFIWNLTKVSQIIQMTGGGPGYETSILAVLLYRYTYEQGDMGIAYAVGVILFLVTIGFVALFIREFERSSGGGVEA